MKVKKKIGLVFLIFLNLSCERKDKLIANYTLNGNLNDYAMAQVAIPIGDVSFVKTKNTKGLMYRNKKPLSYLILPEINLNPNNYTISMIVNFNDFSKNNSIFFYGSKKETWGSSGLWIYTEGSKVAISQNKQVLSNIDYGFKTSKNTIFNNCENLKKGVDYLLIVVYQNNTLTIFINGKIYAIYDHVKSFDKIQRRALIGVANNPKKAGKFQLDGVIDEIKIYNKALTTKELNLLVSSLK